MTGHRDSIVTSRDIMIGALLVPSLLLLGGARAEQRFSREPSDVTQRAGQR